MKVTRWTPPKTGRRPLNGWTKKIRHFCDIKMPGMDGTEVLDKLVSDGVDAAVVMISGHGDIDTAVECIKKGAFDFIQKPLT